MGRDDGVGLAPRDHPTQEQLRPATTGQEGSVGLSLREPLPLDKLDSAVNRQGESVGLAPRSRSLREAAAAVGGLVRKA